MTARPFVRAFLTIPVLVVGIGLLILGWASDWLQRAWGETD